MTQYAYRGLDRAGIGRTGRTAEHPAQLVPRLYAAGWRRLVVTVATDPECEVGWIWRNLDTGKRTWSADLVCA